MTTRMLLMNRQTLLKKIKTPLRTKKIEFLLPPTFGTFAFAANAQANAEAKAKEPNLLRFIFLYI